jgi:hypothetical protein
MASEHAVLAQGGDALKAFSLINGGALVATLAFLGQRQGLSAEAAAAMSFALWVWAGGLLLAAASYGLRYLADVVTIVSEIRDRRMWTSPLLWWSAVLAGLGSLACFAVGAYMAGGGIEAILTQLPHVTAG